VELDDLVIETALLIIPLAVFFLLVDRKRIKELYPTGLWAASFAMFTDHIGGELVLWQYSTRLLISHIYPPMDIIIMPVQSMLLVQFLPPTGFKRLFLVVALSGINTISEFLLMYYTPIVTYPKWSAVSSFIVYIVFYFLTIRLHQWYTSGKALKKM